MFVTLPAALIMAALVVYAFVNPTASGRLYIGLYILLLEGYSAWALWINQRRLLSDRLLDQLTEAEADLVGAYKFHFLYPFAAREFSASVALVALCSLPFAALLFWKGVYLEASIIALNFLVCGPLSHKLSPYNGLTGLAQRGDYVAYSRLEAWPTAWEKVVALQQAGARSRGPSD